jgi:hypothetical protein
VEDSQIVFADLSKAGHLSAVSLHAISKKQQNSWGNTAVILLFDCIEPSLKK